MASLKTELKELSTAEDFLDYFDVEYDEAQVNIWRLHILKRLNKLLATGDEPQTDEGLYEFYRAMTERAYVEVLDEGARGESIIIQRPGATGFVGLGDIR